MIRLSALLFYLCCFLSCHGQVSKEVLTGADQVGSVKAKLKGKRVALVVNHTALIGKTHLVDTLKNMGISVVRIFGPEHGFRGAAADGEIIKDSIDLKTGIPVASLYGKNKKPTNGQLNDIDVVVFDIQDVGARFYTYIGTLHYVMEACAENKKKLIVLDRPNPNGSYVDGPVLQPDFKSFVGMHPVPIVHGLTVGEFATMINGEGWLSEGKMCSLEIVKLKNWKHTDEYALPVKPSPNLPNDLSVKLYPSLCLMEGTVISVGRGTQMPFQILGNPELKNMEFQFTPLSIKGTSNNPPHENKICYGMDLRTKSIERKLDLNYLLTFYKVYPDKEKFFTSYFDRLAGTSVLKQQIKDGLNDVQIRESWRSDLETFQKKRKKYLLYP